MRIQLQRLCVPRKSWSSRTRGVGASTTLMSMSGRIPDTLMQEIKIYDATRMPANWTEVLSETQFVVFASDAASGAPRNPRNAVSGEQSTCLIFDSLDEAVAYCGSQQDVPRLRLDIYD